MENIKNGYKQIIKALDDISDTSGYVSINTVKVLLGENIGKYIAEENSNSDIKVGDHAKVKSLGIIGTVENITGEFVSIKRDCIDYPVYTTIDDLELISKAKVKEYDRLKKANLALASFKGKAKDKKDVELDESKNHQTIDAEYVKEIICNPDATVESLREIISKLNVDQLKKFAICCDRFTFFEDLNSTHDVLLQINAMLGSQMANYYIEQKLKEENEIKSVNSKLENDKKEGFSNAKESVDLSSGSIANDIKNASNVSLAFANAIKNDIDNRIMTKFSDDENEAVKSKLENAKSDNWLGENFSDTEIKVIQTVALLKAKSQLLARKLSKKVKDTIKNNL